MPINFNAPNGDDITEIKPRITVVGVGGAGGNAVNNMIEMGLEGCEFVVANTDAQALASSRTDRRIQLGLGVTQGLGAGSRPEIGRAAAEEAMALIEGELNGSNMVFVASGMGGGTGTGAAPVIARAARERGILTVGVITRPFHFEGTHRMRIAEAGIEEMQKYVDTLIVIPNQNLFRVATEKTTFASAFKMADNVLYSGVRSITDLMVMPGLINLDFADVRAVMSEMGKAMMGTGEASGERRALEAAEAAISNPLLEDTSVKGAHGVLINITGGADMTLFEVDEAANRIRDEVDPDAHIIFGSTFDLALDGKIRVSVVATGIDGAHARLTEPAKTVLDPLAHVRRTTVPVSKPAAPAIEVPAAAVAAAPAAPAIELPKVEEPPVAAAIVEEPAVQSSAPDLTAAVQAALAEPPAAVVAEVAPAPSEKPFVMPVAATAARLQEPTPVDPMGAAEMINGGHEPTKPAVVEPAPVAKKANIFKLVTGIGGRKAATPTAPQALAAPPVAAPTVKAAPAAPVFSRPSAPAPAPAAQPVQPSLGLGLGPVERPSATSSEDELLEIPAFLRRQMS